MKNAFRIKSPETVNNTSFVVHVDNNGDVSQTSQMGKPLLDFHFQSRKNIVRTCESTAPKSSKVKTPKEMGEVVDGQTPKNREAPSQNDPKAPWNPTQILVFPGSLFFFFVEFNIEQKLLVFSALLGISQLLFVFCCPLWRGCPRSFAKFLFSIDSYRSQENVPILSLTH